jgi:oligosaccharyltransferase complex subunit gamma
MNFFFMKDALTSFFAILLVVAAPKMNAMSQRFGVMVFMGLFMLVYSIQLRIFKMKNGGYPFQLF